MVSPRQRRLQERLRHLEEEELVCKSEDEIREYLKDKTLVVYAAESFVEEEDQEVNNSNTVSYMVPVAEKRLDFKYHKTVDVQVEENIYILQDKII